MAEQGPGKIGPVNPTPVGSQTAPGTLLGQYGIDPFKYDQAVVTNATPNPRILEKVARETRELVLEAASIGDAEPYAFGTVACKPLIIAADDSDETLVLDCLWSVGEVESVCNGAVSANDIWAPDIGFLSVAGASFEHFTGTSGQSASTIMTNLKGSYDALPDKAHSVISMQDTWNLNFFGFVSGVKVTDPRNSPATKVFSENPALILADIFIRSGYTVDWDSVSEAANYADTPTYGVGSPQEPRWLIRGHITTKQELRHWVHALAQYAGSYVDVRGGQAIFVVDKARASNHTVVAADIVSGTARLKRRGSKDAPSKVTVNVRAPGGSTWAADYGTSAGAGTESVISMPYWESTDPASMKAKEIYLRGQHEIESFEFIGFDDGLIRTLGDVGTITYAPGGLSSETMALTENEPVGRGRWRRKYIPYDAADYPSSISGATTSSTTETVNNPYFPPQGPTPTLSFDTVTSASPNYDRIKIDFSPQTWAYLNDYKVTVTTTADTDTILYQEYIAKGSETGSPETITTYTDFPVDFTDSPENVYRVNVYLRSNVSTEVNEVLGAPGTADIERFKILAKHFGQGGSPENYYQSAVQGASPDIRSGFIKSDNSSDTWEKMTLVFCVNVQSHADAVMIHGLDWFFGVPPLQVNCKSDGSMEIIATDLFSEIQRIYIDNTDSPQPNPWPTGQWRAFMICVDNNSATSPHGLHWDVYAADVGTPGSPTALHSGAPGVSTASPASQQDARMQPHGFTSETTVGTDPNGVQATLEHYMSFVYCDESYMDPATNWSKFFDSDNKPIDLGADGSNPTSSQPDFYAPDCDLTNNLGFGIDWLEIGTVPDAPSSPTD